MFILKKLPYTIIGGLLCLAACSGSQVETATDDIIPNAKQETTTTDNSVEAETEQSDINIAASSVGIKLYTSEIYGDVLPDSETIDTQKMKVVKEEEEEVVVEKPSQKEETSEETPIEVQTNPNEKSNQRILSISSDKIQNLSYGQTPQIMSITAQNNGKTISFSTEINCNNTKMFVVASFRKANASARNTISRTSKTIPCDNNRVDWSGEITEGVGNQDYEVEIYARNSSSNQRGLGAKSAIFSSDGVPVGCGIYECR